MDIMNIMDDDDNNSRTDIDILRSQVNNHISGYTTKYWIPSILECLTTLILFSICLMWDSPFVIPLLSLTFVRIFILFHDMAHYTFFPFKMLDWLVGNIYAVIVFTSFTNWVETHTYHHSHANKIDKFQHSQTAIWDVEQYLSAEKIQKLLYSLTYGKYTLFTANPPLYFLIYQRFVSTLTENILNLIYVSVIYYYLSYTQFLYYVFSIWIASILGFILFHAQHTFDGGYREYEYNPDIDNIDTRWSFFKNGMYGSSFIQIPFGLDFFTCNIQYHHIHHLNSNIPCYNLRQCHEDGKYLFNRVKKVSISDIIKSLKYSVYDYKYKKFDDIYNY